MVYDSQHLEEYDDATGSRVPQMEVIQMGKYYTTRKIQVSQRPTSLQDS